MFDQIFYFFGLALQQIMSKQKVRIIILLSFISLLRTGLSAVISTDPNCLFVGSDGKCLLSNDISSSFDSNIGSLAISDPFSSSFFKGINFPSINPSKQGSLITGATETLSREDYLRDKKFLQINEKLRFDYKLPNHNLKEVTRTIGMDGSEYSITYQDSTTEIKFKTKIDIIDKISVLSQTTTTFPSRLGMRKTLAKAEYTINPQFIKIDEHLRKEYSLIGFSVVEVTKRSIRDNFYSIAYTNGFGDIFIFEVTITIDGVITVTSTSTSQNQGTSSQADQTETLTKTQYEGDQNFNKIDGKLRQDYNLTGLAVGKVTRQKQAGNGYLFEVTYNSPEITYIFKVYISSIGAIQVRETRKSTYITNQPTTPTQKPVAPIKQLSEVQYLTDRNFRKINDKLRNQNDLARFNIRSVNKQQLESEDRYEIAYSSSSGIMWNFNVAIDIKGQINVKDKSKGDSGPVLGGGFWTLSKDQYKTDESFIKIDAKLRSEYRFAGFFPVQVKAQVVTGLLYQIAYVNQIEQIFFCRVVDPPLSISTQLQIVEVSGNPPVSFEFIPTTLNMIEYLRDKNYLKIDEKLRGDYNLKLFNLENVTRQFVNGYIYTLNYKEGMNYFTAGVNISPEGNLTVQYSKFSSGYSYTGAPRTLTKAEYSTDKQFLTVDTYLRGFRDLTNYTPVQVLKQVVAGTRFNISYVSAKGDIYNFIVVLNLQNQVQFPDVFESHFYEPISYSKLKQVKETPTFSACLLTLIQSTPKLADSKIVDITTTSDSFFNLITYTLLLSSGSGNYEVILQYDTFLKKASVKSVVTKIELPPLRY